MKLQIDTTGKEELTVDGKKVERSVTIKGSLDVTVSDTVIVAPQPVPIPVPTTNESPNGKAKTIINADGDTYRVEAPTVGKGWTDTNPNVSIQLKGQPEGSRMSFATGNILAYKDGIVMIGQTTGEWFRISGKTSVSKMGNNDPFPDVKIITLPTRSSVPTKGLTTLYSEADLASGKSGDIVNFMRIPNNAQDKQGMINFYYDHIVKTKTDPNGLLFALMKSDGTNPPPPAGDGSTWRSPTVCSWKIPLGITAKSLWVRQLVMAYDVAPWLLEQGVKFGGMAGSQGGIPSITMWAKRPDMTVSPPRYDTHTYGYYQGGVVQDILPPLAAAPTGVYMYEKRLHCMEMFADMNTPGQADGTVIFIIDGKIVYENHNMKFRDNTGSLWAESYPQIYMGGVGRPAGNCLWWQGPFITAKERIGMYKNIDATEKLLLAA